MVIIQGMPGSIKVGRKKTQLSPAIGGSGGLPDLELVTQNLSENKIPISLRYLDMVVYCDSKREWT